MKCNFRDNGELIWCWLLKINVGREVGMAQFKRKRISGKISRITLWAFDLRLRRDVSPNFQPRWVSLRLRLEELVMLWLNSTNRYFHYIIIYYFIYIYFLFYVGIFFMVFVDKEPAVPMHMINRPNHPMSVATTWLGIARMVQGAGMNTTQLLPHKVKHILKETTSILINCF